MLFASNIASYNKHVIIDETQFLIFPKLSLRLKMPPGSGLKGCQEFFHLLIKFIIF